MGRNNGHEAGDRVLIAFADMLRARLRDTDLIVRSGGRNSWCCSTTPIANKLSPSPRNCEQTWSNCPSITGGRS
ncbi:diguanylate cyclase domain-containing protein [Ectothiorhodospira sp. BSL-9]|uniref:diguanylate cyclase domain-containing protein n=1 Tax=Ectothiorhodospira sp. BSL-9 TaxID=1442136 RepID=UPI003528C500